MTVAIHEEGTYTDTPGDTWDVIQTTSPNTTEGVFQFSIALNALVAGETVDARLQVKDAASGTLRTVWQVSFTGAQAVPGWVSKAIALMNDWDFSMRQRTGTGRAIKWSIVKVI